MSTPMSMNEKFLKNDNDDLANEHIYKSLVGSLICLTNIRPHIMHVIIIILRYMDKPMATMSILKYIKGAKNFYYEA